MINQNMHIHSKYSWDGEMEIEEIAKCLADNNIKYGAITDHVEFDREDLSYVISKIRFRNLEIDRINELYQGRVVLLKALEISEPHLYKKEVSVLNDLDLDFTMGSIHKIDKSSMSQIGIKNAYKEYYDKVLNMIELAQVNVIGHLDYINRYFYENALTFNQAMEIMRALKDSELVLEINTSARRRDCDDLTFPSEDILQVYSLNNANVTIGTDAHRYKELLDNLDAAEELVEKYSLKPVVFQKRKRIII